MIKEKQKLKNPDRVRMPERKNPKAIDEDLMVNVVDDVKEVEAIVKSEEEILREQEEKKARRKARKEKKKNRKKGQR